jgi:hypothetical protein
VNLAQIQSAIASLPANELAELIAWLQSHCQQVWDKQIEDDLKSGRFDHFLAEVDKEHQAWPARLARQQVEGLERKHRDGYQRHPVQSGEFDV